MEGENKIPYVNRVMVREYKDGTSILLKIQGNKAINPQNSCLIILMVSEPINIMPIKTHQRILIKHTKLES